MCCPLCGTFTLWVIRMLLHNLQLGFAHKVEFEICLAGISLPKSCGIFILFFCLFYSCWHWIPFRSRLSPVVPTAFMRGALQSLVGKSVSNRCWKTCHDPFLFWKRTVSAFSRKGRKVRCVSNPRSSSAFSLLFLCFFSVRIRKFSKPCSLQDASRYLCEGFSYYCYNYYYSSLLYV